MPASVIEAATRAFVEFLLFLALLLLALLLAITFQDFVDCLAVTVRYQPFLASLLVAGRALGKNGFLLLNGFIEPAKERAVFLYPERVEPGAAAAFESFRVFITISAQFLQLDLLRIEILLTFAEFSYGVPLAVMREVLDRLHAFGACHGMQDHFPLYIETPLMCGPASAPGTAPSAAARPARLSFQLCCSRMFCCRNALRRGYMAIASSIRASLPR